MADEVRTFPLGRLKNGLNPDWNKNDSARITEEFRLAAVELLRLLRITWQLVCMQTMRAADTRLLLWGILRHC